MSRHALAPALALLTAGLLAGAASTLGCAPGVGPGPGPGSGAGSASGSAAGPVGAPSGGAPSGGAAARDPSQASLTTPAPVAMPFEEYFGIARAAEQAAIERWYQERAPAYQEAQDKAARCMGDLGFEWFPSPLVKPEPEVGAADALAIPALPAARAETEVHGYGRWTASGDEAAPSDVGAKLNAYLDGLGEDGMRAFYKALLDDPACGAGLGEDFHSASGDAAWYVEPVQAMTAALVGGGAGALMGAEGMLELNAEWGDCMTKAGALGADQWRQDPDRPGPANAFDVAAAEGGREQAALEGSPGQLAIALADFDCRQETDYLNRFAEIQRRFEERWVAEHRDLLAPFEAPAGA